MEKKHVLFVCYANWRRSPTAERVFKEMVSDSGYRVHGPKNLKDYDFKIASAGVDAFEDRNQLTKSLAKHFDLIFALDGVVEDILVQKYDLEREKIINLSVPDVYYRDEPELVRVLKEKLEPYIPKEESR